MRSIIICLFVVAIACYAEGPQVPQEGEVTSHIASHERGRRVESRKQVTALVGGTYGPGLKGKNAIDRGARAGADTGSETLHLPCTYRRVGLLEFPGPRHG